MADDPNAAADPGWFPTVPLFRMTDARMAELLDEVDGWLGGPGPDLSGWLEDRCGLPEDATVADWNEEFADELEELDADDPPSEAQCRAASRADFRAELRSLFDDWHKLLVPVAGEVFWVKDLAGPSRAALFVAYGEHDIAAEGPSEEAPWRVALLDYLPRSVIDLMKKFAAWDGVRHEALAANELLGGMAEIEWPYAAFDGP